LRKRRRSRQAHLCDRGQRQFGHLAGELLKSTAKIDVTHVPYKGGAPAITDLVGERISFMPINAVEVMNHIKSAGMRPLAVASDKRFPLLPDVPRRGGGTSRVRSDGVVGHRLRRSKTPRESCRSSTPRSTGARRPGSEEVRRARRRGARRKRRSSSARTSTAQTDLWTGVVKAGHIQPE
jgi:hypothetical protein